MRIKTNRKSGFTLVEIMIVVAIIGLLAAIAIPNFVKARTTAQKNACINNLRQIDGAKEQWALENRKGAADAVTSADVIPYIKGGATLKCPAGGADFDASYAVGDLTEAGKPTCKTDAATHVLP
jgi:prepilin-type N-terminal cleavage/methylation domain-containing protein